MHNVHSPPAHTHGTMATIRTSAAPTLQYVGIPKTDAYIRICHSRDVSSLELSRPPGGDTHMHGFGEDFPCTSVPDALHVNKSAVAAATNVP